MLLPELRAEVCALNNELPANNLVAWTSGNVSARDPETGLVVIKPSGVKFRDLTPENMVIVDLDGKVVEAAHKPSSDTASHCYIYRHRPDVFGVAHTHSRFATAFAALGRSIPCVLTAMADEFGGDIPCGGFALIGGEQIGKVVIETLAGSKSLAALLQNHGVFTIGKNAEEAVKAAVMTEDNAAIVWAALQLGEPLPISAEDIASLHHRYTHVYGQ
ncbi:MAG: L-ribulose-5-phosphate 4-epimerase [Chloroflexi bacterium]|jgi:L-ribulose-5-phosphate 4-epimerase|nr:L-ribulose-5-phosphate 4-epimerase [Chloroflexota bacterium]MDL1884086.1 L-ribulose-5-phosphate 4-epimerase [Anaerolineae bacterium CFX8]GIL12417.1 MAG: L-ribulose-5-phosphate 4-epimerase [Chloroflexota bacterium]